MNIYLKNIGNNKNCNYENNYTSAISAPWLEKKDC